MPQVDVEDGSDWIGPHHIRAIPCVIIVPGLPFAMPWLALYYD